MKLYKEKQRLEKRCILKTILMFFTLSSASIYQPQLYFLPLNEVEKLLFADNTDDRKSNTNHLRSSAQSAI